MEPVIKAFRKLQDLINAVIGVTLIVIMCVILLQTCTRYVIFYSLPWSEELSRYLFVVMILFGINIGITQKLMVRIDLIDNFMSDRVKFVVELGRQILSLAIAGTFFYSTFGMVKIGGFQKSPAMQLPMNLLYMVLAIGFLLAVCSVFFQIVELIQKRRAGELA